MGFGVEKEILRLKNVDLLICKKFYTLIKRLLVIYF